MFEISRTAAVV